MIRLLARRHGASAISRVVLRLSIVVAALLFAGSAAADYLIVERNVNLRADPSTNHPAIRLLHPPDELELLQSQQTNHYFHVRTEDNEEGWVWSHNVRLSSSAPTSGGATASAASISSSWDKPQPNTTTFTGAAGDNCGPTGDGGDPETNGRKNRTDVPTAYHAVTFDAVDKLHFPNVGKIRTNWSAADRTEIERSEGVAVTVVGYLVAIKPQTGGSGESSNCHLTQADAVDWHLALAKQPGQGEKDALVIETTPRVRKSHPKWTTGRLSPWRDSSDPVRISGWVLFDPDHRNHLGTYRNSLWEIHPITEIEVWKDGGWKDLDQMP